MLERIGSCRIVEEVASGGMAVVYRAIQDHLNRTVAIKALKTAVASDDQLVTRFEREAQSLANLQHENIIHIYDFYRERGALFIVMEFVQGIDLYDLLDIGGRVPYDVASIIAMQVARALDYVHYRGIIHRDIKPANVMLSRQGGVKLMDFGIARDRTYESDLTETGTGIGTPSYMSPEQILGDKLDARSDIFSLGILLYQMVTGAKPFVEDEQRSVMHKIRLEKHERARKLNPDIPRELERIIDKCLQKEPRHRWRSAQALVMALERFLSKHVEMNYNSRLVLFLKNQDIITSLEADEYLNPDHGDIAETVGRPNIQARRMMRRSFITHGVIFGIVALMTLLIHLAPVGSEVTVVPEKKPEVKAYVKVIAHPWGRVTVKQDEATKPGEQPAEPTVYVTPMAEPIEIAAGIATLTIDNDYFAPIVKKIDVDPNSAGDPKIIQVDFEAESVPVVSDDEDTEEDGE